MNKKKLIIFDLDGVLINSLRNMKFALSKTNKKLNLQLDFTEYKRYIGLPFKNIISNMRIKKNLSLIEKTYNNYAKKNKVVYINKKTKVDLMKLKRNYKMAIFTSKNKKRTNLILKEFKIFECIVCPEDIKRGKPFPDGITKILKKTHVNKKSVLYIGDSYYDWLAAKNAKINYRHAEWGYDKSLLKNNKIKKLKKLSDIQKIF
jgi:phosphoglycolate phosphatase